MGSKLNIVPSIPDGEGSVEITEAAARAIEKYLRDNGAPDGAGLRIGVRGGGCSGLSYFLDVEAGPKDTDKVLEAHGVQVFIDPKSLFFLSGSTLDYVSGLMEAGFKFINPKAGKPCGCGESFGM